MIPMETFDRKKWHKTRQIGPGLFQHIFHFKLQLYFESSFWIEKSDQTHNFSVLRARLVVFSLFLLYSSFHFYGNSMCFFFVVLTRYYIQEEIQEIRYLPQILKEHSQGFHISTISWFMPDWDLSSINNLHCQEFLQRNLKQTTFEYL